MTESAFANMDASQLEDLNDLYDAYTELVKIRRHSKRDGVDRTGMLDAMQRCSRTINAIEDRLKNDYFMTNDDINTAMTLITAGRKR